MNLLSLPSLFLVSFHASKPLIHATSEGKEKEEVSLHRVRGFSGGPDRAHTSPNSHPPQQLSCDLHMRCHMKCHMTVANYFKLTTTSPINTTHM